MILEVNGYDFSSKSLGRNDSCYVTTWRIIPVSKLLVTPFISH